MSDTEGRFTDRNDTSRFQVVGALAQHSREFLVDGFGPFIFQPKDDKAWQVLAADGRQIAEIQVKGQQNTVFASGLFQNFIVRKPLEILFPEVDDVMPLLPHPGNGFHGNPHVRQKLHKGVIRP